MVDRLKGKVLEMNLDKAREELQMAHICLWEGQEHQEKFHNGEMPTPNFLGGSITAHQQILKRLFNTIKALIEALEEPKP